LEQRKTTRFLNPAHGGELGWQDATHRIRQTEIAPTCGTCVGAWQLGCHPLPKRVPGATLLVFYDKNVAIVWKLNEQEFFALLSKFALD